MEQSQQLVGKNNEQVKTWLQQYSWFKNTNSTLQDLLANQASLRVNQNKILASMEENHLATVNVQHDVNLGHLISLYGNDITKLNNIWTAFKDMEKDYLGGIIENYLSDEFLESSKDIKSSMNNVIHMLTEGHPLKPTSLWQINEFCTNSTLQYFNGLLVQSFDLRCLALNMQNYYVRESECRQFNESVYHIQEKFKSTCIVGEGFFGTLVH